MKKTIAQKIFESHVVEKPFDDTWVLKLDRVFCHEITTPVAITDLMERKMDRVFDPTKIKAVIDHVTPSKDSKTATQSKILRDWARRNNIKDFFDIGANGVCHAIFPEKGFVRPGFTIIMGDSHTCTHGAFGAFAAGVGTTDLEVGILKGVCSFKEPKTIKFVLNGTLPEGVYAKDVILFIIGQIGVNGATNCVMEFTGPIVDAMSMEARMTLCNMAIEAGGTSGICMPDMTTVGTKTIVVEYEGEQTQVQINVVQAQEVGREILGAKSEYNLGETFDLTSLKLKITYEDGSFEEIDITSSMVAEMPDMTVAGEATLEVV